VSVSRRLHLHRQSHRSCVRPDSISHAHAGYYQHRNRSAAELGALGDGDVPGGV